VILDLKDFVKMPFLSAIVGLGLVAHGEAGFLPRFPQDPSYVQLSAHCSFYALSVDSTEWRRFGLAAAPVIEPSRFNQGEGIDVLAVPSDRRGRVAFAPAYITVQPDRS
jgi:hypothetical protein